MGCYLRNVSTLQFDPHLCVGCGMCESVCPQAVFSLLEGKAVIGDRDACMECGACARNCPTKAIFVEVGVGCPTAIVNAVLKRKGRVGRI